MALDGRNSRMLQAKEARICIEVDICSALPPVIYLNGHSHEVIYENLHFFSSIFSLALLAPPLMPSNHANVSGSLNFLVPKKSLDSNSVVFVNNQMVINEIRNKNSFFRDD